MAVERNSPARAASMSTPSVTGVMHMLDTLEVGGRERLAVDLVNLMPRERYALHLCTTRWDGPLAQEISDDVGRLKLNRRRTFELTAMRRLTAYIRQHDIRILHAHGTAILAAALASLLPPFPRVVWHDHYGTNEEHPRSSFRYRLLATRVSAVLAASQALANWSCERLHLSRDRVSYLPNFAREPSPTGPPPDLPGTPGRRIVCVANLRPAKDHFTLIDAMARIHDRFPYACLLLVGLADGASDYVQGVYQRIESAGLRDVIVLLGQRKDVPAILAACDIGTLSSHSEGLPVSLLEYGMARLPVVATRVGQCSDVLQEGRLGKLVPPREPGELSKAIMSLLDSPPERDRLGAAFQHAVRAQYSAQAAIGHIEQVYRQVAGSHSNGRMQRTVGRNVRRAGQPQRR